MKRKRVSKKQKGASSRNWLLFRVAGIRSALALDIYKEESIAVKEQVLKVAKEAKKLQELLQGE